MGLGSFHVFISVLLLLVLAVAAVAVGIVTDFWYIVEVKDGTIISAEDKRMNEFHFGFWRRCYDDFPSTLSDSDERSGSDCLLIYKELLPESESDQSSKEKLVLHLSRSYVGLAITCAVLLISTILVLLCGSLPGNCKKIGKPKLYIAATIVILLATIAGVASGVCFIAAREVEDEHLTLYPEDTVEFQYGWSFMLHWIGTGLALLNGFLIVCLLRNSFERETYIPKQFWDSY